jgi:hypothetical protein
MMVPQAVVACRTGARSGHPAGMSLAEGLLCPVWPELLAGGWGEDAEGGALWGGHSLAGRRRR